MSEDRPGDGKITSPGGAKEELGRTSFQRVLHEGQRSNPTEWQASNRLAKGDFKDKPPTDLERDLLFEQFPGDVKAFRSAGMSDEQIIEILNKR